MNDDDIIARGGTEEDIRSYAESNGATDPTQPNQYEDTSELVRLARQAIVKNNLRGTIGELCDEILVIITQQCNQAVVNELQKVRRNAYQEGTDDAVEHMAGWAKQEIAKQCNQARIEEVERAERHVFKLRTNFPRLRATPPQMDEYYRQRKTELAQAKETEGE